MKEQTGSKTKDPVAELEEQIAYYKAELERLKNKSNFPYVYIVVAIPTTVLFVTLSIISNGLIDFTSGITAALFFSLLITCAYLVLYQPNREEMIRELVRKIRKLTREKAKLEAGIKGEREVAYHLRWLPKSYIVLNDIKLPSEKYETQQFDHIVVGPNGLFHLETKSVNGIVVISETGDWTLIKAVRNNLVREGMDSPHHQIQRHEMVLREFLKANLATIKVPLRSVVVMAHPKTIVEGEDPHLPVIKKDKLLDFIQNYESERRLNKKEVRQVALALVQGSVEE
ncbi:nuclease-related domain-containing protein [Calderihabitans maritimus]|uniref:NERD domain protein n=1 Tax=Calderihabitans maritimus TaxID=1246530 RepID=A0A1Z5HYA1_9FIRM|nr:nuclease-related domain-containing protein [Calderihabitans maritimus]GAW94270.1 NERD domain protein [Calderihabitans maritimus]